MTQGRMTYLNSVLSLLCGVKSIFSVLFSRFSFVLRYKWLHSFQANEDHLSRHRVKRGRDEEITKIFTSQCCLLSIGTLGDIGILGILFLHLTLVQLSQHYSLFLATKDTINFFG